MDWFRMYGDMPNDPKIGTLNDGEFRTWVELLCAACKAEREGGTGLTAETVNWALRRNVTETLQKLLETNLVRFSETGELVICNWEKRQYASDSSTARVRRYREKQKNQTVSDETLQERSSNGLDTEQIQKQNREEKKKPKATPAALPDWLPHDAWEAFVAMRKAIKKPITADAVPLAIRKLDSLRSAGNDPRLVLEQSTLNSWQGLFEVRPEFKARDSPGGPLGKAGQATAAAAQRFLENSDASH